MSIVGVQIHGEVFSFSDIQQKFSQVNARSARKVCALCYINGPNMLELRRPSYEYSPVKVTKVICYFNLKTINLKSEEIIIEAE